MYSHIQLYVSFQSIIGCVVSKKNELEGLLAAEWKYGMLIHWKTIL